MAEKLYSRLPVAEGGESNGIDTTDGVQAITIIASDGHQDQTKTRSRSKYQELCGRIRRPGWKWVILVGAFMLRAVFTGFLSNYTTLSVKLREFYGTNEEILGWIGSLILSSRSFCSPLTVVMAVKIGYRSCIFIGVLLGASSLMISSFVPSIHWYFLTLSVLLGSGMSLACFSSYDYLMSYFHKTFVRASGIMAMAASAGLMICAPAMESLLESIGLHNTLRVFSGIILLSALAAFTFRPSPAEKRRMSVIQVPPAAQNLDSLTPAIPVKPPVHATKTFRESLAVFSSVLRSVDMWILGGMGMTLCLASTFTYLYMVSFLNTLGLSAKTSAFALSMMGVGQFVGTALSVLLGDRVPLLKMEVLAITALGAALVSAALTVVTVYPGVLTLVIVLGLCRGIYNLMVFPCVIECMGKHRKLECCAISNVMCGIGYLPGGVIGGALYDATGTYLYSLLVCVALYLTTSILLVWVAYRFRRARRTQDKMIDQSAGSAEKGDRGSEEGHDREVYVVDTIMTTV